MVFNKPQAAMFYNTISGQHFKIEPDTLLSDIINQLQDSKNGYCIDVSENDMENEKLIEFIRLLRDNFCGDIINQEFTGIKPYSLYPQYSVINGRERLLAGGAISIGEKVLDYLQYFTLQITGKCHLQCDSCPTLNRQIMTCSVLPLEMDISTIENTLIQLTGSPLKSINIIGGNPFSYSWWEELISVLKRFPFEYTWHIDYRLLSGSDSKIEDMFSMDSQLVVIFQGDFDKVLLKKEYDKWKVNRISFNFHISSEKQYEDTLSFCEDSLIENYTVSPVYNSLNEDFFKEFIYIDEESIVGNTLSKKTIFANMNINKVNFGKIIVLADGEVYTNMNYPSLGNINNDSIHELLVNEMRRGGSWFKIRDQKPCSDCLYQWLCPSPSNYEFVIGKSNLCHIR